MKISIHQPNLFPYMGFFQKMEQSDMFVIMSHCQYEKNGYQNRFNIGDKWYTLSVERGLEPIINKRYTSVFSDWHVLTSQLPQYRKLFWYFDHAIEENLSKTNSFIIKKIAQLLEIKTEIKHDYDTKLTGTERLIHICQNFGATKYLSGISGRKYLNIDLFCSAGIEVEFQDEATMDKRPILEVLNERLSGNNK